MPSCHHYFSPEVVAEMSIQIYLGMKTGIGAMLRRPSLRDSGTLRKPSLVRKGERLETRMGVRVGQGTSAGCQVKLCAP